MNQAVFSFDGKRVRERWIDSELSSSARAAWAGREGGARRARRVRGDVSGDAGAPWERAHPPPRQLLGLNDGH